MSVSPGSQLNYNQTCFRHSFWDQWTFDDEFTVQQWFTVALTMSSEIQLATLKDYFLEEDTPTEMDYMLLLI